MRGFLVLFALFTWGILIHFSCTNKDVVFDPTEETGVTIEAYVCDTIGVDTTFSQSDSLPFAVFSFLSPVLN